MDKTTNGHSEDLQNFILTLKADSWPEVCSIIIENKSGYWVWFAFCLLLQNIVT